ncbi:mandelate racemase/muconate lactonizing enzyme family protein [Shinella daejeonensis]|uniref:mandelate racemase/muconate lactonizing enzyme family protein n=1 Tax=Shinella daejeonensis TaxID=659017 RepID=UPI0020C7BDCE|nr:mandelate racemase/muconate lactonizing enzyme family protein [Shinella daejeonensis]MCP8896198.1 mandelate racemase/muconate lactonizing enzyme family protein [Shinella daejeonensis]
MKITAAEVILVEIPFALRGTGVGIMPTAWKTLEFALVRVEDELGNIGWGEGFGYSLIDATKSVIDRLILPSLVGAEIDDIPAWNARTQRQLHMFGRYGVTIFAISGVDIALWDLAAKRAGKPLHQLLATGGDVRRQIPFYASLVRYAEEQLVVDASIEVLDAGFRRIKLHEITLPAIRASRRTVGNGIDICVDVNCAWSVDFVEANRKELDALQLTWLEEPIYPPEDFTALAGLRGKGLNIAAGENWCTSFQVEEALKAGAVDYLQPSMTKIGGISEYLKIVDIAESHGSTLMPHSPYFGPGFYASLQVAAARPAIAVLEYNFVRPDAWLADVEGLRDGELITVPDRPGIGFEPDPDVIRKYGRLLGRREL